MTEAQFFPIYNFLQQRKNGLTPFFISLPQHKHPQDSAFSTYVQSNDITVDGDYSPWSTSMEITTAAWSSNTYAQGLPKAGDLFTIYDANDTLHVKAYMIAFVETHDAGYTVLPADTNIRIHFFPGLQRKVTSGAKIIFYRPLIRVASTKGLESYRLENDNLYQYSLDLQEELY